MTATQAGFIRRHPQGPAPRSTRLSSTVSPAILARFLGLCTRPSSPEGWLRGSAGKVEIACAKLAYKAQ